MNTGIVAFTGYNTRAVVAFCRFLKARGLRAHLIAKDEADPIFLTDFGDWVFLVRESLALKISKSLEYFSAIKKAFSYASLLILPTSEYLNRFFLAHRPEIRRMSVDMPLVDIELYRNISDKYAFRTICQQNGLDVPKAMPEGGKHFPFVAKKNCYESGAGIRAKPYLIFNNADYQAFCNDEPGGGFYFEEYVEGESHYLLYHISKNGPIVSHSQQNLIQQGEGRSIVAARFSNAHACAIGEQYAGLLVSLGFHGLIMVEIRKSGGRYFMIEANPRFWGPLQFTVDNCPAMLEQFLDDQRIQFETSSVAAGHAQAKSRDYFWYGGYVSDKFFGNMTSFHGYDQKALNDELHCWLVSDIFLQADTIRLFRAELVGEVAT
jgi:hypothetical protein